jgi:hypothetical protein
MKVKQIGKAHTAVFTDPADNMTKIVYHSTVVVAFSDTEIYLDNGGWETPTTKARMNQASNQFNLGYQVYQKDFVWFCDYKGKTHEFESNGTLTLDRTENPHYSQGDIYPDETCPECESEVITNGMLETIECTECEWSAQF